MSEAHQKGTRVDARLGDENYRVTLEAGRHRLTADEPASQGGGDAGAAPYELLLSGLAACTAITLRMYAQRKGWDLKAVEVAAHLFKHREEAHIERTLSLHGGLTAEQKARLLEISEKTPVTLTLKGGIEIRTSVHEG